MPDRDQRVDVRVTFASARPEVILERVRSELGKRSVRGITLDLDGVEYLGPAAIEILAAACAAARAAGKPLLLDRVPPPVYKALHIAKLSGFLQRVQQKTAL